MSMQHFCQTELPTLIGLTGTQEFLPGLMGATRRSLTRVDVCALFRFDNAIRPVCCGTASVSLEEATRQTAERYVSGLSAYDPLCTTLENSRRDSSPTIFHLSAEKIENPAYREMNLTRTKTVERISIVFSDKFSFYSMNFYRKSDTGRFVSSECHALEEVAPLVASLALKHVALSEGITPLFSDSPFNRISRRLVDRCGKLSQRESDVCALIVLGHSSESIALKMNVSVNSVLTYRKRAYVKLGISSQNELFRICFD
jgi:DNA-binding CsgD family transcriptional regulator